MSILVVLLTACTPVLTSPDGGNVEPWVAPENTWPLGTPPSDLVGEGFDPGEVIPDFRMPDGIRMAMSPLPTSYVEVWDGFERLRDLVASGAYKDVHDEGNRVT